MRMFLGVTSAATSGGQPLAADAVAQGDRHRALGRGLADHVAVQLGHDLARGEGVERPELLARARAGGWSRQSVSTAMRSFV